MALMLLAVGLYLMDQQFVNPMQATAAELIVAAVLVTTSLTMASAILRAKREHPRRRTEFRYQPEQHAPQTVAFFTAASKTRKVCEQAGFRPERYVDQVQIRLLAAPQARGIAGK